MIGMAACASLGFVLRIPTASLLSGDQRHAPNLTLSRREHGQVLTGAQAWPRAGSPFSASGGRPTAGSPRSGIAPGGREQLDFALVRGAILGEVPQSDRVRGPASS